MFSLTPGLICIFGEPVLREKASPIIHFDTELKKKAEFMLQSMYISQGIGLAAPQVGESIQLVVIDLQLKNTTETVTLDGRLLPLQLTQPFCFTNPTIEPVNDIKEEAEEGCLSLPNIYGKVSRYQEIKLFYQDLSGNKHVLQCRNLFARCIQHECDHLQGVLFIDHLSEDERKNYQPLLEKFKELGGRFDYKNKKRLKE